MRVVVMVVGLSLLVGCASRDRVSSVTMRSDATMSGGANYSSDPTMPSGATMSSGATSSSASTLPTTGATEPASLEQALAMLDCRPEWEQRGPILPARHPNESLLKDWVIVLDPGHGGDAHLANYKRGPTGVREAEINFRVAVLLKRLLDDAGAIVTLTRDGDYDLGLDERAEVANRAKRPDGGTGADLFLSLHHNAAGPEANYTSVWFHGPVDDAEVELDVARYLAFNLTRALRTKVAKTQPIMNDRQMYPGGFGVLRHAKVPAVLTESSFHSHPPEEQRLRDAIYNLREAYAIYWALCEYARGGRPTVRSFLVTSSSLIMELDDGLFGGWGAELGRILPSTINVRLNDKAVSFDYDGKTRMLTLSAAVRAGDVIEVRFANLFKHHNYPQRFRVTELADGLSVIPEVRPRRAVPATGPVHPVAPVGATQPASRPR